MTWLDRLLGRVNAPSEVDERQVIPPDEYFASEDVWQHVSSSNLRDIAFYGQGAAGLLRIRFLDKKTGGVSAEVEYQGVPVDVWQQLLSASSHGEYFHANIRTRYAFTYIYKKGAISRRKLG